MAPAREDRPRRGSSLPSDPWVGPLRITSEGAANPQGSRERVEVRRWSLAGDLLALRFIETTASTGPTARELDRALVQPLRSAVAPRLIPHGENALLAGPRRAIEQRGADDRRGGGRRAGHRRPRDDGSQA